MTIFNLSQEFLCVDKNYFISTSLIDERKGRGLQYFALENFVQSSRTSLKLGESQVRKISFIPSLLKICTYTPICKKHFPFFWKNWSHFPPM